MKEQKHPQLGDLKICNWLFIVPKDSSNLYFLLQVNTTLQVT